MYGSNQRVRGEHKQGLNISLCRERRRERWKMEAEERDRESEEEVCDFGVGVGAWGWGGCQLVLFPVDKTLRSLSLCRSLSLSYYAILPPLPPLLCLSPPLPSAPPLTFLRDVPWRKERT